jgi:hypothetical protein
VPLPRRSFLIGAASLCAAGWLYTDAKATTRLLHRTLVRIFGDEFAPATTFEAFAADNAALVWGRDELFKLALYADQRRVTRWITILIDSIDRPDLAKELHLFHSALATKFLHETNFFYRAEGEPLRYERAGAPALWSCRNPFAVFDPEG